MKEILKNLDAKTLTSAGAVIIALYLIYAYSELAGNRINGVTQAFNDFKTADINAKKDLAEAFLQNAKALEGNTKVMEQVLRQPR